MTEVLTPLIDSFQNAFNGNITADPIVAYCELADFARTLERRIATLEQQLAEANAALQAMRDKYEPDIYAQKMRQAVNEPEGGGGKKDEYKHPY